MTPRYTEEISVKSARAFLKLHFDGVRVPNGSRCLWVSGLHYVSDQPGLYLTAGAGGLEGILVIPKAIEQELKAS